MAATKVRVLSPVSGLTGLTLFIADPDADTIENGAGDSLTELTNSLGTYEAIVAEALSGRYVAYVKASDGSVIITGFVDLLDAVGPWYVFDPIEGSLTTAAPETPAASEDLDVANAAVNPKSVETDEGKVVEHDLEQVIMADKHTKAETALQEGPPYGGRFGKIRYGGTV